MSIGFKLVDEVSDFVRGPVLSTAIVGGTTEDHRVTLTKALDMEPFTYSTPIKPLIVSGVASIPVVLDNTTTGGTTSLTKLAESLLLGPVDTHVKFDVGADQFVIYDAVSNTVFTDYTISEIDPSCIYTNVDKIKDLTLLYRTEESISPQNGFVKFTPTYTNFSLAYSSGNLQITVNANGTEDPVVFTDSTSLDVVMNPLTYPEIVLVGKDYYKPWRLQAKQSAHLGKGMYISNISHETTDLRPNIVSNEKLKLLAHNIIQTEQKDLHLDTGYTLDTAAFDGNGFLYLYQPNGISYPITGKVLDIDKENGLILLSESIMGKDTLRISYTVDPDAWSESPYINFNPLFGRMDGGLDETENQYYNKIDLWYSSNNTGLYFSLENEEATKYNYLEIADTSIVDSISPGTPDKVDSFVKIGTVNLNITDPSFLDIRSEGGKLIDKSASDEFGPIYDTRSHVTFGFMGESPEQNNIVVVGIGLNILKPILKKFDTMAVANFYDTYGETIDATTNNDYIIEYINNYVELAAQTEDLIITNTLRSQLTQLLATYVPLGVASILKIANTEDIILKYPDESSFETKIAGEY